MDPRRGCALLAHVGLLLLLVLLPAPGITLDEDLGCGSERATCHVTRGSGELTVLECAATQDFSNGTLDDDAVNRSYSCDMNVTLCESGSDMTNASGDTRKDGHLDSTQKHSEEFQGRKRENYLNRDQWLKSSSLEINLSSDISVLDISPFLNVKTVIMNINGFHVFKVCGATNFSNLTVQSFFSDDLSFLSCFSNVNYLNLSHNTIESIPDDGLPLSIFSLDLSFNNINLNKNYSLPETLRLLNISYNNISNTEEFILKGNVIVLDIRGNKLTSVPATEMTNLEELYMSYNNIGSLKDGAFVELSNLTILDLRGNHLNELEEKVFQGLNRLQWLDLSENNLFSLEPATFQYLNNLVKLILSKNVNLGNFQNIKDASLLFGTGRRLQEIEASGTNLSKIPSTVTRSVRKLSLTDNVIGTIQCGEVDSFPLLQVIDVSNNVISEIEEDALGRLEFLSDLILTGNKLVNVPKSLPNQLKILNLRCNAITKLNNIDFLGLQKLRVLLLSSNNISVIEDGAFGQLINLEVLDLSYNPIKALYRSSFTGPRRLKELYLISLTDLIPLKETLSFPAPESSHLEVLIIDSSPELATRLMDDVAALTMFHELFELSLRDCNLQSLRNDLPRYLTRLQKLQISRNPINCTDVTWLLNWLEILNDSQQEGEKKRSVIYEYDFKCCKDSSIHKQMINETATCATPIIFSGRSIMSLKEDNFTTTTINTFTTVTTRKLQDQLTTEMTTQTSASEKNITIRPFESENTTSQVTEHSIFSFSTEYKPFENVTVGFSENINRVKNTTFNVTRYIGYTTTKKRKDSNSENLINKLTNTWKYYKNHTKHSHSISEPFIVLLNDTNHTMRAFDNQMNDSISSGAFLGGEPAASSHPGMVVFLFVIGVILVASSAMVYSHWAQLRRSSQYQHHQDIEVASFGGNELW